MKIQFLHFITYEDGKLVKWCTTNTMTGAVDFIRFAIETDMAEKFWCIDTEENKMYNLLAMAVMFGIRKVDMGG